MGAVKFILKLALVSGLSIFGSAHTAPEISAITQISKTTSSIKFEVKLAGNGTSQTLTCNSLSAGTAYNVHAVSEQIVGDFSAVGSQSGMIRLGVIIYSHKPATRRYLLLLMFRYQRVVSTQCTQSVSLVVPHPPAPKLKLG